LSDLDFGNLSEFGFDAWSSELVDLFHVAFGKSGAKVNRVGGEQSWSDCVLLTRIRTPIRETSFS
jgi:hypothetical protein